MTRQGKHINNTVSLLTFLNGINAYNDWLAASTLPKLPVYVSPGAINPPEVVAFLSQTLANYETVCVGQERHFIQKDHPEAIGRAISDWRRRNGQ